jgi:tetratricopeptide (TPR) repeat protein
MKLITIALIFSPFLIWGQTEEIKLIDKSIKEQQYDKGLEIITGLVAKNKATNIVYYYKASCERSKGQYEVSVISATTALEMTSKTDTLYPDILSLRAMSYAYSGRINLGIIDNETLVKEFPNDIYNWVNLSYLYGENRQYYNSIKTLKQALSIDSLNPNIYNNLAYYNS